VGGWSRPWRGPHRAPGAGGSSTPLSATSGWRRWKRLPVSVFLAIGTSITDRRFSAADRSNKWGEMSGVLVRRRPGGSIASDGVSHFIHFMLVEFVVGLG